MKTPEEIKKRLEHNADFIEKTVGTTPVSSAIRDSLEYIEWLEKNLQYTVDAAEVLGAESAKFERERDAAVKDLTEGRDCYSCKHLGQRFAGPCVDCMSGHGYEKNNYEWRGICFLNSETYRSCLTCKHQGPEGRGICMDCGFNHEKYEPIDNTEVQEDD